MAAKAPGPCCFTGFKNEGDSVGTTTSIKGTETYISEPAQPTETAVLLLTDVFGININSKLLADDFACNGFLAVIPDLFQGDQVDFGDLMEGKVDLGQWVSKHGVSEVQPIVESTIKWLREEKSINVVAAAGYCFGGKYVTRNLKQGIIDVGFNAHPSYVSEEELAAIEGPLSIAAAETDNIFTRELRWKSEEILAKTGNPYQINLYSGVEHGFAVRGDLTNKTVKYAKEGAFVQGVAWFKNYI